MTLTRDLSLLVRQELELAKAEMTEKGRTLLPGLGMLGGAGVAGLMAAGALTACAVLVLAIFLPAWLAALVVGASWPEWRICSSCVARSRSERPALRSPNKQSKRSKEDVEWAKTRATSARK